MELDLGEIRKNIDLTDDEIAKLFWHRMELCENVARYKMLHLKNVRDSSREQAIIDRLTDGRNEADSRSLSLLYNTIFEISRARQSSMMGTSSKLFSDVVDAYEKNADFPLSASVACQGVEGAYSQIACKKIFKDPKILYFENFESVFKSVESGLCRYGVLPFENSIHGSVTEVYDMLSKTDLKVIKSVKLPIHHALVAKKGTSLSDITEIFSHRQAIGQCSEFLSANKKIKVTVSENTAAAAKMVSQSERKDIAAISSENCAELYDLDILKKDLQNSSVNFTMFYCVSKELEVYRPINKAAFMFNIENKAGALFSVLAQFAAMGVNLTKIESRPISGRDFEFMFYAEADTDGLDKNMLALFSELEKSLAFFKFIGVYEEIKI